MAQEQKRSENGYHVHRKEGTHQRQHKGDGRTLQLLHKTDILVHQQKYGQRQKKLQHRINISVVFAEK